MRFISRVCSLFLGLLLTAAAFSQQPAPSPAPVGKLGHPSRLIVRGPEKIPVEVVKQGLLDDPEVLLAGHPFAPLDDYPKTLQRRATDGYQFEGFPDAMVTAVLDEQKGQIVLTVEEGPRFFCSDVRIEGAEQIDTEKLIEGLTRPHVPFGALPVAFNRDGSVRRWIKPTEQNPLAIRGETTATLESPVWKRGGPAPFGKAYESVLHHKIEEAFADLGYAAADFSVRVVPNRAAETAELRIAVADEGPVSLIELIEVTGRAKNSREALLEYLGLEVGQRYTPAVRANIGYKLWHSGRFLKSSLTAGPDKQTGAATVRIELVEYPQAPPLDAELNQYEQILLRCRDWLADLEDSGYDLVVLERGAVSEEDEPVEIEVGLVTSGRSRAILTAGAARDRDWQRPAAVPHYALVLSDELAIYSTRRGAKLAGAPPGGELQLLFSIGLSKETDGERTTTLGISYGYDPRSRKPPFAFGIRYEPVAFVALAHIHQPQFEIQDGILALRTARGEARIEVETGRLIEYCMRDTEYKQYTRITTEKGAFARRLNELEQATETFGNKFDADRPATSLAAFILEDLLLSDVIQELARGHGEKGRRVLGDFRRLNSLGRKLVNGDVLAPLDRCLAAKDADTEATFRVPNGAAAPRGQVLPAFLLPLAVQVADELFPRNTWAWTIGRETALFASGSGKYTDQTLLQLFKSPQSGPLCQLVVAALLDSRRSELAQHFATRGLDRLTVAGFQNDYRPLLDRNCVVGACVLKAAGAARDFTDEEAETLGRVLFGENARCVVEFVRTLRERRNEPVEDVLPEALDGLWEGGLSPQVSAALQDIQRR